MNINDSYNVSYAQNREDIILAGFFPDIDKGIYVDVGANHPVRHSVTKKFYDKGWTGINFEPNPLLFEQIVKLRPNDTNIPQGAGNHRGVLALRVYHSRDGLEGISTISENMKEVNSNNINDDNINFEDIKVEVETLKKVFTRYKLKHIHFMKVDVEGFEYEVLEGNDWTRFRPELLCIEANHMLKDWHHILKEAKYRLVFNDGLNEYFLAEESILRKDKFDYASIFLLDKPVITHELYEKVTEYDRLVDRNNLIERELNQVHAELLQVVTQRNELLNVLERYKSVKSLIKILVFGLRNKILRDLEKLNQPGRPKRAIHLDPPTATSKDAMSLVAIKYDKRALKESRILHNKLRRILYRIFRFIFRIFFKLLYSSGKLILKVYRIAKRLLRRSAT